MRLRTAAIAAATLGAALVSAAPAAAAEAIHGVTAGNVLVTFHSDSPGALRNAVPVTGLQPGEQIVAVDARPTTGQLYGLGSTSRVYLINSTSGAARALGAPFSPPLAGANWGFDFNPVADRIRLVSDGRQNLRLNPDDGQVAAQDTNIVYAEGDPGAGSTPSTAAAAYSNNVAGSDATQLFVIDSARDVLTLQNPPNEGKLTTVGGLANDLGEPVAFDIAADGRAWVIGRPAGGSSAELYLLDLKTGVLTSGALFPRVGEAFGLVRGIATAGPVPDDTRRPSVLVSVDRVQPLRRLRDRIRVQVSCSEPCSLAATVQRGGRNVGEAIGGLPTAGRTTLKLRPSAGTRRLAGGLALVRLTLRITAQDAAGNRATTRRGLRFTP